MYAVLYYKGENIAEVKATMALTPRQILFIKGLDITKQDDLKLGYDLEIKGFYKNTFGRYDFDLANCEVRYK